MESHGIYSFVNISLSVSPRFIRVIHVVACIRISFFFKAEYYSIVCIDHILFIHSSVNGHLGCFQILASVNNAAINLSGQISVQVPALNSFGYIPQKRNC